MMPLTPASELRDDPQWVEEMLPSFEESCYNDKGAHNLSCDDIFVVFSGSQALNPISYPTYF